MLLICSLLPRLRASIPSYSSAGPCQREGPFPCHSPCPFPPTSAWCFSGEGAGAGHRLSLRLCVPDSDGCSEFSLELDLVMGLDSPTSASRDPNAPGNLTGSNSKSRRTPGSTGVWCHLSPCSWAPGRPGFIRNVTATGPAGLQGSDGHRACPLSSRKQQPQLCVQVAGGPLPLILVLETCLHGASLQGLGLPPTRPVFPRKSSTCTGPSSPSCSVPLLGF